MSLERRRCWRQSCYYIRTPAWRMMGARIKCNAAALTVTVAVVHSIMEIYVYLLEIKSEFICEQLFAN